MKITTEIKATIELNGVELAALESFLSNSTRDDFVKNTASVGDDAILERLKVELKELCR